MAAHGAGYDEEHCAEVIIGIIELDSHAERSRSISTASLNKFCGNKTDAIKTVKYLQ
jgi:hypothetical protein